MPRAARTPLTKTSVEAVAPDPQKDVWRWDSQVPGFGARITPRGQRTFVYQYRTKTGQQRRMALGGFPALTVEKARNMARDHYERVRRGGDPRAEVEAKSAAKAAPAASAPIQTLGAVLDEFMQRHARGLRSEGEYRRALDRYVRPAIGQVPLYDLRRRHVVAMLDDIEANNGAVMADRTLAYLRKALNWQAIRDDDFTSPIVKGMARTKPRERARDRVLSDDELRAVWAATEGAGFGALVRLILLSAQRPGEVVAIRSDQIDKDGVWTIEAADYKTKRPQAVPLSSAALDIIAAQPVRPGGTLFSPWLQGSGKAKAALDKALPLPAWTLHDLRRTARTLMSRAGMRGEIAERVLGHVIAGVAGIYDRHDYLAEKREALERLAREVDRILNPPAGANVHHLDAARAAREAV